MGRLLFPKPKKVEPPPVIAPEAVPTVETETREEAARRVRRRRGFATTVITGALVPSTAGKRTRL